MVSDADMDALADLRRQAEEWLAAHPREGDFASH
jgi:hypothetical protein